MTRRAHWKMLCAGSVVVALVACSTTRVVTVPPPTFASTKTLPEPPSQAVTVCSSSIEPLCIKEMKWSEAEGATLKDALVKGVDGLP